MNTQPEPKGATNTAQNTTSGSEPRSQLVARLRQKSAESNKLIGDFVTKLGGPSAARQQKIEQYLNTVIELLAQNGNVVSDESLETIRSFRNKLDEKIQAQINEIIHAPRFQELEGRWRGLEHLVRNTHTGKEIQIRVMDVRKDELGVYFKRYQGVEWQHNPLYRKIYRDEFSQWGGSPYGCLVGDYSFDHSQADVNWLHGMIDICAAAHCPFIASASPALYNLPSWDQLQDVRDLSKGRLKHKDDYADWNALRSDPDACYLGLTMPRFTARLPYGEKTNPVEGMAFEENTEGAKPDKIVWANAAYAMAANIARAFWNYGQCTAIRGALGGGSVERLNLHYFKSGEGKNAIRCPTEVLIDDSRDAELSAEGLMGLLYCKGQNYGAFISGQSVQLPQKYQGKNADYANANAQLMARLPYMFACCRVAHYLKQICRLKIGTPTSREKLEQELNTWIGNYVIDQPHLRTDEQLAERPFAEARVEVTENPDNPGYYSATFFIKPHYQFEGLKISLSLVSKLPKDAAAA